MSRNEALAAPVSIVNVWRRSPVSLGFVPACRRQYEALHVESPFQARLMEIQSLVLPSIDAGDHDRLVADGHDRPDTVRRDELAPPHGAYASLCFSPGRKHR